MDNDYNTTESIYLKIASKSGQWVTIVWVSKVEIESGGILTVMGNFYRDDAKYLVDGHCLCKFSLSDVNHIDVDVNDRLTIVLGIRDDN
jgi:hypothetical protein